MYYYVGPPVDPGDSLCSLREGGDWLVGWSLKTGWWLVSTSGMVVGWRLGVCIVVDWGREGAFDVGFFGIRGIWEFA